MLSYLGQTNFLTTSCTGAGFSQVITATGQNGIGTTTTSVLPPCLMPPTPTEFATSLFYLGIPTTLFGVIVVFIGAFRTKKLHVLRFAIGLVVLIVGLILAFGFTVCPSYANACPSAITDFLIRYQVWGVIMAVVGYVILFTSLVNVRPSPKEESEPKPNL